MKTFKEKVEALKVKIQAKITADSTPEEIQEVNDITAEIEDLDTSYNEVVTENAKFKDTIVRMVTTEGNDKTPPDGADGSKPMTIEEVLAEVQSKEGK